MKTNLQEMRRKAGFKSARAFAESIPMNPVTYTQYEQGIRNFTLEKAWEFADLLGCSLDELAGRQCPPKGASAPSDPGESSLVSAYRELSEEGREVAVNVVAGMRSAYPSEPHTYEVGAEAS